MTHGGHAIIIGAGIAGLLAGRVLAGYFERVTLVERDILPDEPVYRPGVPQGRHLHALPVRGMREIERLFPGLDAELEAAGAPPFDWIADARWLNAAGWKPRFPSQLKGRGSSRPLLEHVLYRRLAAYPGVRFLQSSEVLGLLPDAGRQRVVGVRVRTSASTQSAETDEQELRADLVVDASGRFSRAPRWLEALGYPAPRETCINAFLGYASRTYRRPPGVELDWRALYLQAAPPAVTRAGVIYPIEGDRWIVTLVGLGRDYPPTDDAGFLEFARSLPDRSLFDVLERAQPLSPIFGFRQLDNRVRHYARLPAMPERFVVLGDAACTFNPVYAQGMTVAALEAVALDRLLRQRAEGNLGGMARVFQRRLSRVTAVPWFLATSEDFRVPDVEGGHPNLMVRSLHRYTDRVMEVGARRPDVHLAITEVLGMVKPPSVLFRPSIAARVMMQSMERG